LDTVFMTLCSVYEVLIMYCVVLFVLSRLMLTLALRGVLCWGCGRAVWPLLEGRAYCCWGFGVEF